MSDYLSRTGSVIVILALMVAAVILATQFSFGRLFSVIFAAASSVGAQGVVSYPALARGAAQGEAAPRSDGEVRQEGRARSPPSPRRRRRGLEKPEVAGGRSRKEPGADDYRGPCRSRSAAAGCPEEDRRPGRPVTPPLPLPEPERVERRLGSYSLPPASLLDAPKAEQQDRRARIDGFGAAARGEVPRVLGRRLGGADSSRSGGHDVRAQAGCRREVFQGDRPVRRPLPCDAGGVGPDRSHSRQGDGRHPDSESESRSHLAARAARVRRLHALDARS